MKFTDYVRYAFKNLGRQKLRTFLTIIAVVIGAVAVTTLISIGQNVSKSFTEMINNMGVLSMVTVSADPDAEGSGLLNVNYDASGGQKITDATVTEVKKINHVVDASPVTAVQFEFMRLKDGSSNKKIRSDIIALDPNSNAMKVDVVAGRAVKSDDAGKIVLGQGAAKSFGFGDNPEGVVGKKLLFQTKGYYTGWGVDVPKPPENAGEDWWDEQGKKKLEIEAEIIGVAAATGEDHQNYTNIEWARATKTERRWEQDKTARDDWDQRRKRTEESGSSFREKEPPVQLISTDRLKSEGYNSIILKVDSPDNTDKVVADVVKLKYGANTAKEMIDQILKLIKVISDILASIGGLALVVAAIGIINTMAMAIFERTREIGVMRACGATRATVRRLFTFEAALIGFLGGALGVAISYGAAEAGNYYLEQSGNVGAIPVEDFVYFPYWLIGGVVCFTTIIAFFAGLYPAFKAARLNPVEALRSNK